MANSGVATAVVEGHGQSVEGRVASVLPTYSIAKTFTASALLCQGVRLDSTVGDYLDVNSRYAALNLKALLQHVSGLPDYHALSEYRLAVEQRSAAWPVEEMLERALAIPMIESGTFSYSNIGFALLRLVLEKTTDMNFFSSLNELVFSPLGISEVAPLTRIEDWRDCELAPAEVLTYDPQWVYPGMVLASIKAMGACFQGIFSGALFDPTPLFDRVPVDSPGHTFKETFYGLGTMIDGDRWVAHGGGGPGFTLFVLCKQDGSAAHVSYSIGGDKGDAPLIAECMKVLEQ